MMAPAEISHTILPSCHTKTCSGGRRTICSRSDCVLKQSCFFYRDEVFLLAVMPMLEE